MKKTYECTVSFTYDAENPTDAANDLIDNIRSIPYWYVSVKETGNSQKEFTVNTETGECEEK